MKANVCFKCQRFFDTTFSFCPYCGEPLKESTISEAIEKVDKAIEKPIKEAKPEISELLFCDLLPSTEKFFIYEFYKEISKNYSSIQMKQTKTYVYFERKADKEIIENYGYWFYFTKKDGVLQFRYREKPSTKEAQKMIEITKSTTIDFVVNTIMKIVSARLDLGIAKKHASVESPTAEKKKLPPRPSPKSIILSGDKVDEKRFSASRANDKKLKEVWEIRRDFIPKGDD